MCVYIILIYINVAQKMFNFINVYFSVGILVVRSHVFYFNHFNVSQGNFLRMDLNFFDK